jgi:pimeloyl-ACP methyl ester carboxylesterase
VSLLVPWSMPLTSCRVLGGAALIAISGCVTLTPYSTIRQAIPDDRFVNVAGQFVYVERVGSGDPVLLLHGFGASSYSWRRVIPTLAERHSVIADLNGFGWTQRPDTSEAYTIEGQARMVIGLLDALGIERVQVVGHSYGGGLALWLAATRPQRIRSLVLVDGTLPSYASERRNVFASIRPAVSASIRTVFLRRSFIRRALERSFFDRRLVTDELVEAYRARLRVEGATRAYQGLTAPSDGPDAHIDLARISQPALLVWGLQDTLLSPVYAKEAADQLPDSRFVGIDRCGHVPAEEQPDALLEAMMPFLAAQAGR